jgi:hypothetical protein
MRALATLCSVGVLFALTAAARADTIVLTNGRTVTGRVVTEDKTSVTLEVAAGRGITVLPRTMVARVDPDASSASVATPTSSTPAAVTSAVPAEVTSAVSAETKDRVAELLEEAHGRIKVTFDQGSGTVRRPQVPGDVPGSNDRIARILAEAKGHIRVTFDDSPRAWPAAHPSGSTGRGKIIIRTDD